MDDLITRSDELDDADKNELGSASFQFRHIKIIIEQATGFLCSLKGYKLISDCTEDLHIKNIIKGFFGEIKNAAVFKDVGTINTGKFSEIWMKLNGDVAEICNAYTSLILSDSAILQIALFCKKNGIMPYYTAFVITAMLRYHNNEVSESVVVHEYIEEYGVKSACERFFKIENEPEILQLIYEHYRDLHAGVEIDHDKAALVKKAYVSGFNSEKVYRGCAQCTLIGLFEAIGHHNKMVFKSASGMSGGMAMNGEGSCGGYAGGIMYMSAFKGRRLDEMMKNGDKIEQYTSYEMAKRLYDKYKETYGTVICKKIHKKIFNKSFCLSTKAVRNDFEDAGAHMDKCTGVIGMAAAWATEILYDYGELGLDKDFPDK